MLAPDIVSNPYGTAERSEELSERGWNGGPQEADGHLTTDTAERNYNFSANCNALIDLLTSQDRDQSLLQIEKLVCFLIGEVFQGSVRDKQVRTLES